MSVPASLRMCVCVRACVYVRVHVRVCACVRVYGVVWCVCVCVCVLLKQTLWIMKSVYILSSAEKQLSFHWQNLFLGYCCFQATR